MKGIGPFVLIPLMNLPGVAHRIQLPPGIQYGHRRFGAAVGKIHTYAEVFRGMWTVHLLGHIYVLRNHDNSLVLLDSIRICGLYQRIYPHR